jgi:hypothetical protein
MPETFYASANILPSIIVQLDSANQFQVTTGNSTTTALYGISQEGQWTPPGNSSQTGNILNINGNAADTNMQLEVYVAGDICLLQIASNVNAGDYIGSNATGYGQTVSITANTAATVIAKALTTSASTSDLVRVKVLSPFSVA